MDSFLSIRLPNLLIEELDQTASKTSTANAPTVHPSDEILVQQITEGSSREALAMLFRRYCHLVRVVALRIVRDESEADDVLQEVFLYVYRKSSIFDASKCSARSWIVQITYHRAISRWRYLQNRHNLYAKVDSELDGSLQSSSTEKMEDSPFDLVGSSTMQELFNGLTNDQRDTLTLHFYEGYTFEEIARKLHQTQGNVRNHYYRGLEKLRKKAFSSKLQGRNGCGRK